MGGKRRARLFVVAVFASIFLLPASPASAACNPLFALLGLCPTGGPGSCLTLLASLGLCKDTVAVSVTPAPPSDQADGAYVDISGAYNLGSGGNPYALTPPGPRAPNAPVFPRVNGRIPVGNDIGLAAGQQLASPEQLAFIAKDSHWNFVRRAMDWAFVEPVQGSFQFHMSGYDAAYAALIKNGIRPIWQLVTSPRWAATATDQCPASNGTWCPNSPPNPAYFPEWQGFIRRIIQRYPLSGGVIVWNEPNFGQYNWDTAPAHWPDPAGYTDLLHASWDGVKSSVNPNMPVLGGALGQVLITQGNEMSTKDYVHGMLAAGAANYMDALSLHPYPASPDFTYVYQGFQDVQNELDAAGLPHERLFVDEWGVRLGAYGVPDEQTRTNQMMAFLDQLQAHDPRLPGADRVDGLSYFVSLAAASTNNASDLNDSVNYSWIGGMAATSTATTFTPRPVYCAMRAKLAGLGPPATCLPFTVTTGGTDVTTRSVSKHATVRRFDLRRWTQRIGRGGLPRQRRKFGDHARKPAQVGRGGGVGGMLSPF